MEVIYENDWMRILKIGTEYLIKYNSGDLVDSIQEVKVSEADSHKAQKSDQDAYDVIIKYQNKEIREKKNKH